jgi:predicted Zn finger-like uncharacterized protein
MPITAQCRSCAARYKVVDSAAGRRVKCRRCGKSIVLPGGSNAAAPSLDLRSVAELERTGQVVATTPESEFQQYQSAVATLTKTDVADQKKNKDYRSIHDLASTPEAKRKLMGVKSDGETANTAMSPIGMVLTGVGGLIFALGALLWIGNVTRQFISFPLAGYITMVIGGAIIGAGRKF